MSLQPATARPRLTLPTWLGVVSVSAAVWSCSAPAGSRGPAQKPGDTTISQCQPSILLIARDESVQVATEWEKGDLVVVGCREHLKLITPEQRASITSALKEAGQAEGGRIRTCRAVQQISVPPTEALTAINRALGATVISDWCWATRVAANW